MLIDSQFRRRRTRRLIVLGAVLVTAFAGLAGNVQAASATTSTHHARVAQLSRNAHGKVRYAVDEPVCSAPARAGFARCYAVRRKNVSKGTPGAYAYVQPATAQGPAGGFTPAGLAKAYGINPAVGGSTQTVGIIDWMDDPDALSNLKTFDKHYGLPVETATSFRKVNQNGATKPLPKTDHDGAGEIALDIESVRAMCNHCKILLVEAHDGDDYDLATAVNTAVRLGATEISNSYGSPEQTYYPESARTLAAYRHPGVVITASTGDDGWFDWDYSNDTEDVSQGSSNDAPSFPASDPDVIAAGGTALVTNADGSRKNEVVWNENGVDNANGYDGSEWLGDMGGTGGGCSTMFPAPSWQSAVGHYSALGCGNQRSVGDISALADPATGFDTYDTYGDVGWDTIGGTSLSAPLLAAMWALAGGSGGATHPAQTLYVNAAGHPTAVYDVTSGGNGWCGGDTPSHCSAALAAESGNKYTNPNALPNPDGDPGGMKDCSYPRNTKPKATSTGRSLECNASTGYDGPSGLGVPAGLGVFAPTAPHVALSTPAIPHLKSSQTYGGTFTARLAGTTATSYAWLWGDGSAKTTVTTTANSASTHHKYAKAGTYLVWLTVTDSLGQRQSSWRTLTVGKAPKVKIVGPSSVHYHHSTRFDSTGSSDPNTGAKLKTYKWWWGDKSAATIGSHAWHTYAHRGPHTVTLEIIDSTGAVGKTTKKISVVS